MRLIYIALIFFLAGCQSKNHSLEEHIQVQFTKIKLLEEEVKTLKEKNVFLTQTPDGKFDLLLTEKNECKQISKPSKALECLEPLLKKVSFFENDNLNFDKVKIRSFKSELAKEIELLEKAIAEKIIVFNSFKDYYKEAHIGMGIGKKYKVYAGYKRNSSSSICEGVKYVESAKLVVGDGDCTTVNVEVLSREKLSILFDLHGKYACFQISMMSGGEILLTDFNVGKCEE